MKTTGEHTNMDAFIVGVDAPFFCDQQYIRDRDEKIFAQNVQEAIEIWLENHKLWIRPDEVRLVKAKQVLENFPTYSFDGKF